MPQVMMKCGCASMSVRIVRNPDGTESRVPSCITHDTIEQAPAPDLTGRTARCAYYGKRFRPIGQRGGNECSTCGERTDLTCRCELPSDGSGSHWKGGLPFFKHTPDAPHDEFYCGCFGWD